MSNPGDLILAATLPELSFTATAIPNANAALQSALPALTFTAQSVTRTDVALVGNFPPLGMLAEARYQSYAVRPITGQSSTRWQHASRHSNGAEARREATSHLHEASRARWQSAVPWVIGVENRRTSTRVRAPLARQTWHQGAAPLQSGAALGHADAIRLRTARRTAFDEAIRAEWLNWAIQHQDGWRDRRFAAASTYQEAQRYAGHFHAEGIRSAVYLRRWWGALWQAAMRPDRVAIRRCRSCRQCLQLVTRRTDICCLPRTPPQTATSCSSASTTTSRRPGRCPFPSGGCIS